MNHSLRTFCWNNFVNARSKSSHPHNGCGVLYEVQRLPCVLNSTTGVHVSLFSGSVALWILIPAARYVLSVYFQIATGCSPHLWAVSFSIGSRYRTRWYLLGELSLWICKYCPSLVEVHVHKQRPSSHCRSVRWNTVHVGAQYVSKISLNFVNDL